MLINEIRYEKSYPKNVLKSTNKSVIRKRKKNEVWKCLSIKFLVIILKSLAHKNIALRVEIMGFFHIFVC